MGAAEEDRGPHLSQSVSRALRVLDEIGSSSGGLSAKELARRCGLTLPTTYHLLRTLSCDGYVVRRDGGSYVLGLKIAGHFQHLVDVMGRPPRVHDVLRHLAGATGHSAFYGQVVDGRIVFTDLFEGPRSPHVEDLVVGFSEAAHATALGKALLSTLPVPQRRGYLMEQGLQPFTGDTARDIDQVDHEVRLAGLHNVFVDLEEFRAELCCAAVVVPGDRPAAIAMTSGLERWKSGGRRRARCSPWRCACGPVTWLPSASPGNSERASAAPGVAGEVPVTLRRCQRASPAPGEGCQSFTLSEPHPTTEVSCSASTLGPSGAI